MRFSGYVKDKIHYLLSFIVYILCLTAYLKAMKVQANVIGIVCWTSCIVWGICFWMSFWRKSVYLKNIEQTMENLEEKYLISEIIEKPRREENLTYFRILKSANKSMLENVTKARKAQKAYKEYIEGWVHEIKIPITATKLLCENHPSDVTEKIEEEMNEINNYVEQALFYARLDQVSNDFLIREINLTEMVRNVIARNKKIMLQKHMKIKLEDSNITAYTDEKWLEFIVNQIIINSIQYQKPENAQLEITIWAEAQKVILSIKDNGIGIKASELDRIFEKGFTGTNGRKQKKSTGIGLYLCQKLCQELGLEIKAESVENEFTNMNIIIPKAPK